MRRRLIAAVILAAVIVVCVSGCHFRVTVHASPARCMPHWGICSEKAASAS